MQRGADIINDLGNVKTNQAVADMRINKLEEAIINMNDNVKKIADKILK